MATEWFLWFSGIWPLLYSCLPALGFLLCICQLLSALNVPNQQIALVPQASCCVSPFSASQPLSPASECDHGQDGAERISAPFPVPLQAVISPLTPGSDVPFACSEVVKTSGRGNSSSSLTQFWELRILMKCPPYPNIKNVFVSQETLHF